jgi:hypothetical protein
VGQRSGLEVEGQEGGVAQLAERPLVGIGDEVELAGPDDGDRVRQSGRGERRLVVLDQEARIGQLRGKPG